MARKSGRLKPIVASISPMFALSVIAGGSKARRYCWPDTMRSAPPQYVKKPLLRSDGDLVE